MEPCLQQGLSKCLMMTVMVSARRKTNLTETAYIKMNTKLRDQLYNRRLRTFSFLYFLLSNSAKESASRVCAKSRSLCCSSRNRESPTIGHSHCRNLKPPVLCPLGPRLQILISFWFFLRGTPASNLLGSWIKIGRQQQAMTDDDLPPCRVPTCHFS